MDKLYKIVNGERVEFSAEDYAQHALDVAEAEAKLADEAATEYQRLRAEEYGKIEDQLDMIYHGGLDAWKAHIATIKAKYPKPE